MLQPIVKRRDRLAKQAAAAGIDRLMVCDPLNLFYLTGVRITPYERFVALMLDARTGRCQLILPSLERDGAGDSGVDVAFYGDQDDPFAPAVDFFGACRMAGVEKEYLTLAAAERIFSRRMGEAGVSASALADISPMIGEIRRKKDAVELDCLRQAARHSDGILNEIAGKIRKGQTEREVAFAMMAAMAAQAELLTDAFVIQVLSGPGSADPHGHPGNRVLQEGFPVTIDFGVCYRHYWSDCTRTFFMGEPDPQFKAIYAVVLEAQERAIAAVRPGVRLAEIDLAARKVIDHAGYGRFFIHRVGHGIGINIHEPPSVHCRNAGLLEEGMVITVEPGIYLPGQGGVRIEDDVAVTAGGHEVLTRFPKAFEAMIS